MLQEIHHLVWAVSAEGYRRSVSENNDFYKLKQQTCTVIHYFSLCVLDTVIHQMGKSSKGLLCYCEK